MADENDPQALKTRLDKLAGELKTARPAPPPTEAPLKMPGGDAGAAMSMGMKAGSEFVAAVIVGTGLGWGLDWLAHTRPAFTIVFFLIGVVAGIWNVIRATSPKRGE